MEKKATRQKVQTENLLKPAHYQAIKSSFRSIDKNGDGKLSVQEYYEAAKKIGHDVTKEEIKEMFKDLDDNDDGVIDYKEYEKAMVERYEAELLEEEVYKQTFEKINGKRTGKLTAEDLSRFYTIELREAQEMVKSVKGSEEAKLSIDDYVKLCRK